MWTAPPRSYGVCVGGGGEGGEGETPMITVHVKLNTTREYTYSTTPRTIPHTGYRVDYLTRRVKISYNLRTCRMTSLISELTEDNVEENGVLSKHQSTRPPLVKIAKRSNILVLVGNLPIATILWACSHER